MKKEELDLSKAHVDQFKSDPKSYSGSKLALTEAGWATVTEDGTIIEVLDAFPASQDDIFQQLISRGEVESTPVLDETDLINPIDIGLNEGDSLNDSSDKNGELTLGIPVTPFTATITNVDGLQGANISPDGISATGTWNSVNTTFAEITVGPDGGSGTYEYNWFFTYGNNPTLQFAGVNSPDPTFTKADIENLLGAFLSSDEEDFIIKCIVDDGVETIELPVNIAYQSVPQ